MLFFCLLQFFLFIRSLLSSTEVSDTSNVAVLSDGGDAKASLTAEKQLDCRI